ncbi:MAG: penicillin binding protein transpeptidase domain-containing protein, partial [Calditrichaeota bacterium]|nr:penicillin binding protein transpeptidase domain-containing protein [Calditrichota bacterium]
MKKLSIIAVLLTLVISCAKSNNLENIASKNMTGIEGTIVFIDLSSEKKIIYNSNLANTRTTPCSTFKIWNTLIGIENNQINSENDSFYIWDGISRAYPDWNKDLNLYEAFQYSCVPAYQFLANKIGHNNMQLWID